MDSQQRQQLVSGLAVALKLCYEPPFDVRGDTMGGTNYFQLGRAWGIYESMLRLLPEAERNALLSEARSQASNMTSEEATTAFLQTNQEMSEAFGALVDGFRGED